MTKDEILATLPKLTRPDLEVIQSVATHLLGGRVGNVLPGLAGPPQIIFNALTASLGSTMPYLGLPFVMQGQFNTRSRHLMDFLNKDFEGWDKSKITAFGFLRMLFNLLVNDLNGRGLTPTIGILINNMGRLPEVFDDAFPNYRASGLGKVVLKNFQKET